MKKFVAMPLAVLCVVVTFVMTLVDTPPEQVKVFTYLMALGCFLAGIYITFLQKALQKANDGIEVRNSRIRKLSDQQSISMSDQKRLSRDLDVMRERYMAEQNARAGAEHSANIRATIIRRLNGMLQDAGIDTTAANIPPIGSGNSESLHSSRVSRGNPVPPPGLSAQLRQQVTPPQQRSSGSSHPSNSSVPWGKPHDNGDLLTGVAMGMMLADDPAPTPAVTYCAPEPTRSEPTPACSPSRDSDYGGGCDSSYSDSSSPSD